MTIYLLFKDKNTALAKRLSDDLNEHNIKHRPVNTKSLDSIPSMDSLTHLVVVLSPEAVADDHMMAIVKAARERRRSVIPLRAEPIDGLPSYLASLMPLDFSSDEHYLDSFWTLIDDLAPPTAPRPILPLYVQHVLENLDTATLEDRQSVVKTLSNLRQDDDEIVRAAAQQALRDIAFKDKDAVVKRLAGNALQSFEKEERAHVIESAPPRPNDSFVAAIRDKDDTPAISKAPAGLLASPRRELWQARQWYGLLLIGLLLGIGHGFVADELSVSVAIVTVFAVLTWFNTQIRAGGSFVWEMPGPLVGNFVGGVLVALVSSLISTIFDSTTLLAFIVMLMLGGLYGLLIGWMSTLRV